jgi:hypothetical protein
MMRPNIAKSILGGFLGTVAITFMMYVVSPMMMGMRMDIAAMLGTVLGIGWTGGMALHFVNGTVIFPLIYALVLYQWLPGGPAVKGLAWGGVLWLLAQTVVMPMMGGGFFSAQAGGAMAAVGSLLGHAVYGAILGALAGEAEPVAAGAGTRPQQPHAR